MNNTSTIRSKVAALIVAHNPDYTTFALVLGSVARQVDRVIIVDNGSDNRSSLEDLCKKLSNCEFIEVGFNSGVAHALKVGARHAAIKHHPEWLLFLDDDTVVLNDALNKSL
jgi:rhamnosyltransferase